VLYLETSALLAFVFEQDGEIEKHLRAGRHVASALSFAEAIRAGRRAGQPLSGQIDRIEKIRSGCEVLPIDEAVLLRVEQRFPVEPLRTLDAIHLATALKLAAIEKVTLLSTARRLRENAVALGLAVLP
jgi:predicted nucleic acid-binding protein